MIVFDPSVAVFVAAKCGVEFAPPFTALGLVKDGRLIAGAVFNVFEGPDVHVSIGGAGWTREFIQEVGGYVFDHLKCERITAITEHPHIVRYAERLGGQIEGCLRNHFGKGRDGFVVGILKEEWKF